MSNPNFSPEFSTHQIWVGDNVELCLSDKLEDMDTATADKAPSNHTHEGYSPTNHSHDYNDLSNKPTIPTEYTHPASHPASMITGLSTVATSGSYTDLSDKPSIPDTYTHPANHPASMITGLATVATTGDYNDLTGKPTIPTVPSSLPANGGDADTVDGKHAADFAEANHKHTTHSGDITIEKVNGPGINLQATNSSGVKTRIHKNCNETSDYGTCISDYDANGKRDYLVLRRASPSVGGKLMLNVEDANGGATEMYQIYGEHNKPGVLWRGTQYVTDTSTVTPSKPLSECRTGWMLLWSDYDPDTTTANDGEFVTTLIPRITPTGANWNGQSFSCEIPRFIGSDTTNVDTEKRIIKIVYIYNDKITGHSANNKGTRTDVVLRAVYEF